MAADELLVVLAFDAGGNTYDSKPTCESSKPCKASVRLGSSARLPSFRDSVNALNRLHTLRDSKASCRGSRHSWRTGGADADIGGADDEVMGFDVGDVRFFVGSDAFVLIMPFGEQESDGATHQLRQVADDEPGVLAGEFDLAAEAQIVANEHAGPGDDAGGERFVVAVTEAEHPAVVVAGFLGMDFHEAEVALALVGQRVCLRADAQVGGGQGALHGGDELMMRNRAPTVGVTWCGNGADFVEVHMRGSAMQGEVGAAAWRDDGGK